MVDFVYIDAPTREPAFDGCALWLIEAQAREEAMLKVVPTALLIGLCRKVAREEESDGCRRATTDVYVK